MVIQEYLIWQFIDVPVEIIKGVKNYLKFYLNYFSIPFLLKTFFSPWRRYYWSYGGEFNIKRWVEVFFSNLISRIMGMIMRFFLVCFGILTEIFIFIFGSIIFFGWLIAPFFLICGLVFGFMFIFGFKI